MGIVILALPAAAVAATPAEIAAMFGAREGVEQLSLSPAGTHIAFLAPTGGQGSTLYTVGVAEGSIPAPALSVSGKPDRIGGCHWVSETRLLCTIYGVVKAPDMTLPLPYSRLFAVDANGGNQRMVSTTGTNHQGPLLGGGQVIDWLPGQDGRVLLSRYFLPTDRIDTHIGSEREGLGVEAVDTGTMGRHTTEQPRQNANEYITDGHGTVRIVGFRQIRGETGMETGLIDYRYRGPGAREWLEMGVYNSVNDDGFNPYAVDGGKNLAYGFRKKDGRLALYTKTLDQSGTETLIFSRPDVDVDGLARIGRERRVVGVSYVTDQRHVVYFDPEIKAIADALHRALPKSPLIDIVDSSSDGQKLLIFAGSDDDPGRYYLFDRATRHLQVLMQKRPQLEGATLANVKAITYRAADGTEIPAYLTLPLGGAQKQLPGIVLPHGGPASRDEWGFDWLAQFFAARGYAVIQPEFRGSAGYGDAFFERNGFQSWRIAIGDVADAGRYLIAQGIVAPARLTVFGASYGGYAALQAAAVYPDLFKAVVAWAPVTDLATLKAESHDWSNRRVVADFIGSDPAVVRDGSPAQNAAKIKAPVLLFHGTLDRNVAYQESTLMASKLRSAGVKVDLVSFDGLDHYLEDSVARAQVLERSDAFLRAAIGG